MFFSVIRKKGSSSSLGRVLSDWGSFHASPNYNFGLLLNFLVALLDFCLDIVSNCLEARFRNFARLVPLAIRIGRVRIGPGCAPGFKALPRGVAEGGVLT